MRGPNKVEVKFDIKLFSVTGTWEPNDSERGAAWELYVELVTRVAVVPLHNGILREALSSYYNLFAEAREILRRHGPDVASPRPSGEYSFGFLTVALLNLALRPFLSYWHPELAAWEDHRTAPSSVKEHEDSWARVGELRTAIEETRSVVTAYAAILASACGVPDFGRAIELPLK